MHGPACQENSTLHGKFLYIPKVDLYKATSSPSFDVGPLPALLGLQRCTCRSLDSARLRSWNHLFWPHAKHWVHGHDICGWTIRYMTNMITRTCYTGGNLTFHLHSIVRAHECSTDYAKQLLLRHSSSSSIRPHENMTDNGGIVQQGCHALFAYIYIYIYCIYICIYIYRDMYTCTFLRIDGACHAWICFAPTRIFLHKQHICT